MSAFRVPVVPRSGRSSLLLLLIPGLCAAQGAPPIHKDGLLGALEHKVAPELIRRAVCDIGVDFALAPEDAAVLARQGVDARLIAAVRENKIALWKPGKDPFTRMETILKLRGGSSPDKVAGEAMSRGVNFKLTPEVERAISAAGGDERLIGVLALRYRPAVDTLPDSVDWNVPEDGALDTSAEEPQAAQPRGMSPEPASGTRPPVPKALAGAPNTKRATAIPGSERRP